MENIKKKLAVTIRKLRLRENALATITKQKEDFQKASLNVLEDLSIEKSKVEIARAKEAAILSSIGDGLLATDEKGNIILINKTGEKLLGIKGQKVLGESLSKTIPIEDEKGVRIPLEKRPINMALLNVATTTTTTGPTYYYVNKDKIKFPVAITVTPVIFQGKVIGAMEIFRNITEEKAIDRAKSEFVSLASHQLKTPPTAIKLLVERILKGAVGEITEKQKEYLNDISFSNQRTIDIVNALLNISHIELGTFSVNLQKKDISAVVENLLNELKFAFEKKHLVLTENYQKNSRVISIDETLFRMIINNIVTNAINYSSPGGKIKVEYREVFKNKIFGGKMLNEDSIAVIITDTGYGIPKDQQSKLFTKFFRADNVRQKQTDGIGLGLYIVKSILDNTGGSIWFSSIENKGTTFYITIPITGMKSKENDGK